MAQQIYARTIIEMLGKPKDYIEQTLKDYVARFKKEVNIVKEDYAETTEQKNGLFSVFVELEIKFKSIEQLFGFCLDAMPSSVEILEPAELKFDAQFLTNFVNDIQAKLHDTDMIVKTLSAQNKHLDSNATNVFHNFIVYLCKKPQTIQQISPVVGVPADALKPFMDHLISEKRVTLTGNAYQSI